MYGKIYYTNSELSEEIPNPTRQVMHTDGMWATLMIYRQMFCG